MATFTSTTTMHGRIPAGAVLTTRVFPIDLVAAEPVPGLASAARRRAALFYAAEQAAAMNAVLVTLNGLMAEGCKNSAP